MIQLHLFDNLADWQNPRAFGVVHSKVEQYDRVTEGVRYYITSLEDESMPAEAVRKHGGLENSLHWCLDMTFREDLSRVRRDHSAENMVVVRHMALILFLERKRIKKNLYSLKKAAIPRLCIGSSMYTKSGAKCACQRPDSPCFRPIHCAI